MMIAGAREGRLSGFAKLLARAMAQDLRAIVIPGPDVACASGLDIEAAGLRQAVTPRDASVVLLIGDLAPALCDAAAITYAQLPRPRAVLALGQHQTLTPLPVDIAAPLSQSGLESAVERLRCAFSQGAFALSTTDFDTGILHGTVEYVCPMHPDVVAEQPGSCPKCGMSLVAREAVGHETNDHKTEARHDNSHHDGTNHDHAAHDSMNEQHHGHGQRGQAHHHHESSDHGDQSRSASDHSGHDHSEHDHGDRDFMSMVEVTRNLPRSRDGLPMDWLDVPFGPLFPGLPGGLRLVLTLDGDGVAAGRAESVVGFSGHFHEADAVDFVDRLAAAMPLAKVAYRVLACRALENAAGLSPNQNAMRAQVGALEQERISSHLGWLVQLAQQIGLPWLGQHAGMLQRRALQADRDQLLASRSSVERLWRRLVRTPLMQSRLSEIGQTDGVEPLYGPVARAAGIAEDARLTDECYQSLGFAPVVYQNGDAVDRLRVRIAELAQSLDLIEATTALRRPDPLNVGDASGMGQAVVETPRGRADLRVTLQHGRVIAAELDTACNQHMDLVPGLIAQRELGDALVAVGSLDISPWEVLA